MGRIVRRGNRWCIQNIRNGVIGRCFATRSQAERALMQLKRTFRRR